MTTCSASNDENFVKIATFRFSVDTIDGTLSRKIGGYQWWAKLPRVSVHMGVWLAPRVQNEAFWSWEQGGTNRCVMLIESLVFYGGLRKKKTEGRQSYMEYVFNNCYRYITGQKRIRSRVTFGQKSKYKLRLLQSAVYRKLQRMSSLINVSGVLRGHYTIESFYDWNVWFLLWCLLSFLPLYCCISFYCVFLIIYWSVISYECICFYLTVSESGIIKLFNQLYSNAVSC